MAKPEPHHLTRQIVIAMLAGIVLGVILNQLGAASWVQLFVIDGVLQVVGSVFVSALKMMVVPLVFVSLVVGVTAMSDLKALGRIGIKALTLYLATTAVAVTIALSLAGMVGPGQGFDAGDCVVSCIVAKNENALDQSAFNDPDAGSIEAATRHSIPTPPTP